MHNNSSITRERLIEELITHHIFKTYTEEHLYEAPIDVLVEEWKRLKRNHE